MPSEQSFSVTLFGASGLVGGHCLDLLRASDYVTEIVVPGRRPLADPSLLTDSRVRQFVIDFNRLDEHVEIFDVDVIICTLGTTIKKAGSKEQFRRVDHDYPVEIARRGQAAGIRHYLLVSAIGADPESRVFYNRVKGEAERDVHALGLTAVAVVRPSLLLGERDEFRLGEEVAKRLAFLIPGRYRPVHARDVASTLVEEAVAERDGFRVIESSEIRKRARSKGGG